jgi:hypothetical protein
METQISILTMNAQNKENSYCKKGIKSSAIGKMSFKLWKLMAEEDFPSLKVPGPLDWLSSYNVPPQTFSLHSTMPVYSRSYKCMIYLQPLDVMPDYLRDFRGEFTQSFFYGSKVLF